MGELFIPIYEFKSKHGYSHCPIVILPEDKQEGEVFKPITHEVIPNIIEGRYYCSNFGRIWDNDNQKYVPWHLNKPINGSCALKLAQQQDVSTIGRKDTYVHQLVANVFLDNENNYPKIIHKDSDPTNNHVDNLTFGTNKDVLNNAVLNNKKKSGCNCNSALFNEEQLNCIVNDLLKGISMAQIAKKYNTSIDMIYNIKNKRRYKMFTKDISFN